MSRMHGRFFVFASLFLSSVACDPPPPPPSVVQSCPNDVAEMGIPEMCTPMYQAYQDCTQHIADRCGADGKTNGDKVRSACQKETDTFLNCVVSSGGTCGDFAQQNLGFEAKPGNLDASMQQSGEVRIDGVNPVVAITCAVVDEGGVVIPDKCKQQAGSGKLTYGPLNPGVYSLRVDLKLRNCPQRTLTSSSFQVVPGLLAGKWTGTQNATDAVLDYGFDFAADGSIDWSRVDQLATTSDLFPGCKITRLIKGKWSVVADKLTLTGVSGTIERVMCKDKFDEVTPPQELQSGDLMSWAGSNGGKYAIAADTLTITSREEPPALKRQ